jgi:predicted nucleotidyltransferase
VNVLLSGVVGSKAYGLDTPDSDTDYLGIYACNTRDLHGLKEVMETRVLTNPDTTFHEARKYCKLALRCNPTVTELLWLRAYDQVTDLGRELINVRYHLLSQHYVRNAYLGYATRQLLALKSSSVRSAKHAWHLRRLIYQGTGLWGTGELKIKVDNPGAYHEFGERVAAGEIELAAGELAWAEKYFDEVKPAIPEKPNDMVAERWLQRVRREYLRRD